MTAEPFFRRSPQGLEPTPVCRGPWGPTTLHGRVVAGLIAHDIEQRFGSDDFRVVRLTTDLWRMPTFATVTVLSELVRQGGRIRVVDSEFIQGDQPVGRASCVMLRTSANPEGERWTPPPWNAPAPAAITPERPPANSDWQPMWETRAVRGGFGSVGPKACWIREIRPLIDAEPLTPFQRVALAADFTNPFANSGSGGLQFLNVDIGLYLHRYPATEWVGFDVASHQAADGLAVGECILYDEEGAIGHSLVTAVANRRGP